MSMFTDQPFSENEERYFLAEILKKSNLPPVALMNLIREASIEPAWNEIALPNGRSVSSCQYALNSLLARAQQQQQHQPQQYHQQQPSQHQLLADSQRKSNKRPYSMGDATNPITREIQPRPTPMYPSYGQQTAPSPVIMSPVEPPRKKRGRPTKAEYEKRSAEATARGEVWPKPRNKPKARRTSETLNEATMGAGSMDDSGGESAGPSSTRPGEPPAPTAVMSPPRALARSSIQDMILPAGQAQDDVRDEGSMRTDPTLPYYSQQQPLVPRMASQPRMPGSGPGSIPPFSPQLGHQFHPTGYQSPASHQ